MQLLIFPFLVVVVVVVDLFKFDVVLTGAAAM